MQGLQYLLYVKCNAGKNLNLSIYMQVASLLAHKRETFFQSFELIYLRMILHVWE